MDNRILYYIWLSNVLRPGNKYIKALFAYFGSIEKIYGAQEKEYGAAGVKPSDAKCLANKDLALALSQYEYCKKEHIGFMCFDDPFYPERLKITDDPPCMFYYRGRLQLLDDFPCVAMVGTRKCTKGGFRLAYKIAYGASSYGITIVNGLAAGIDGACIAAALDANGYAVGLLGCGIDRIYPLSNKDLFYRLSASGLILTEFPPFTEPKGSNFPVRNRVISGLCLGTCVFEADADRSGAMITAHHALEQGRHIFAVPGNPDDKMYSGALELIKDGAFVLTDAEDIASEYSMMFPHRINLRNKPEVPEERLEKYVSEYFGSEKEKISPKKRLNSKSAGADYGTAAQKTQNTYSAVTKKPETCINNRSADRSGTHRKAVQPHGAYENAYQVNEPRTETSKTQQNISESPQDSPSQREQTDLSMLSPTEKKIYHLFAHNGVMTPDEIAREGIKIEDVLSSITLLEVYDFVEAMPGGRYKFKSR